MDPTRLCALKPIIFYGYMKSLVYANKSHDDLETNIRRITADLGPKLFYSSRLLQPYAKNHIQILMA